MTNSKEIDKILKKALELVVPSDEEKEKAKKAEMELRKRLDEVFNQGLKQKYNLEYKFLGSYARDTWLKNNLEIDVFLLFPEEVDMDELEKVAIEIGKAVVDEYELRYAAHPYVHGKVLDVEVDVVPCYRLKSLEKIKSAVDRTPFHHEWLKDRIRGKENEVRLLKQFLKAGNLYGAEYKVRGFSGYLCELLIVFYGSFYELIRNATKWSRKTVIDVLKGEIKKGRQFFVVDPVDAKRNVAANLSLDNLARFVERCRNFIERPSIEFFVEPKVVLPDDRAIISEIESRNTALCVVEFEKPKIVEDNLYPQLERACNKIEEFLKRQNFMPLKSDYYAGKRCYLIVECQVKELARIDKRIGPPFEEENHVKTFLEKNRDYKPFIEDGRYCVYVKRKYWRVEDAIVDYISKNWKGMGKNVGVTISKGFRLHVGRDVLNEELKAKLVEFLALRC
ncbi:CCA tRNA nucleotidyltransferase [Archaeoglobales archaeon]|nr:MAG: CCA tRNA nucleotidyltransferase [Archaeoglobales archaeon]